MKKPKNKCYRCERLIASKKLISSPISGQPICRYCYKLENSLISQDITKGLFFIRPIYCHPSLKLKLINEQEELVLINKYSK